MCQRTIFSRSCRRMAEEAQLRAEEEFMVEALKMIKQQRNCLQIERLHLESLKQQLMNPEKTKKGKKHGSKPGTSKEGVSEAGTSKGFIPSVKPTEMMSAVDMMSLGSKLRKEHFTDIDDMQCNNQKLNLNLSFDATTSAAGTSNTTYPHQYDYNSEEGPSSEESDGDNVMIDMNMLMNATSTK